MIELGYEIECSYNIPVAVYENIYTPNTIIKLFKNTRYKAFLIRKTLQIGVELSSIAVQLSKNQGIIYFQLPNPNLRVFKQKFREYNFGWDKSFDAKDFNRIMLKIERLERGKNE